MCQVVAYQGLKTMENHCRQAQNVVVITYRRWLFTRGSYSKALTWKILVLWIGGRLREVVAHGGSTRYSITAQFFSDPDFSKVRIINPKVN